jgi:ATP-dependent Zn protease
MTARKLNQRKSTAYHEAGHAVIARVLTLASGQATIKANYRDCTAGYSITADPWTCIREWENRGKVRGFSDAVFHARIIAYMAGAETEAVLLEKDSIGDGDDRKQVALMAEELNCSLDEFWDRVEVRLRAVTRMLIRRHRDLIERTAKALLKQSTISGPHLDRLIGRSVDNVKVNAPFLLMASRHTAAE